MKHKFLLTACMLAAVWVNGCAASHQEQTVAVGQADIVIETEEEIISIETETSEQKEAEHAPADTSCEDTSSADAPKTGEPVRLLFSGDVLLSDHVLGAYEKAGGIQGVLDDGYRRLIDEADFFFVNEEFPFSDRGTQAPDKQYTFRLSPERVSVLKEMGVDGVSVANNHALDFGTDALLDTCDILDAAGIWHTGAGANLDEAKRAVEIEIQNKKIAIIGATRVIPVAEWAAHGNHPGMLATYDPELLLQEIRTLSETNDYVIVFVHWGIERAEHPETYQRELGKQYIDAGADMVIGSHPHVLQGVEYYNDKPIVYSLGNFVFGSSIPRTMLLEVELSETPSLIVHPGTSSGGYTRMLTDSKGKQEFYDYLTSISYGVIFEDGIVMPQP
ncbi:MAG: CapA family protein [Brotaphodocola sp.]